MISKWGTGCWSDLGTNSSASAFSCEAFVAVASSNTSSGDSESESDSQLSERDESFRLRRFLTLVGC